MNLENYSHEEVTSKSLIELAKLIMSDERKAMNFNDIFKRVATLKGLNDKEKEAKISQFYTDINMDGCFVTNGANIWGLKRWYRVERMTAETTLRPKSNKNQQVSKEEVNDLGLEIDEFDLIDEHIDDKRDEFDDYLEYDDEDK